MSYKDPVKQREAVRRWNEANPRVRLEISRRYASKNRTKEALRSRLYYTNNPIKRRETYLNCEYGPGAAEHFKKRLEIQQGLCDACGEVMLETPRMDHDHETNQLRGLLHDRCNKTLGTMKENTKHLRMLADYLEKWKGEQNAGI